MLKREINTQQEQNERWGLLGGVWGLDSGLFFVEFQVRFAVRCSSNCQIGRKVAHMESKQHAPKKRVMCVSGAIQTQFFIIYTTCIINSYIEKYILALDVAASCLFNLWKVKSASGVAWRLLHARSLVCSCFSGWVLSIETRPCWVGSDMLMGNLISVSRHDYHASVES